LRVILVGQSNGIRRVRWGAVFALSCVLGAFAATIATSTYFALSGSFSVTAMLLGFFGPFVTIAAGIQRARNLPVEHLQPLNDSP
jgi:hypothetical protein